MGGNITSWETSQKSFSILDQKKEINLNYSRLKNKTRLLIDHRVFNNYLQYEINVAFRTGKNTHIHTHARTDSTLMRKN